MVVIGIMLTAMILLMIAAVIGVIIYVAYRMSDYQNEEYDELYGEGSED